MKRIAVSTGFFLFLSSIFILFLVSPVFPQQQESKDDMTVFGMEEILAIVEHSGFFEVHSTHLDLNMEIEKKLAEYPQSNPYQRVTPDGKLTPYTPSAEVEEWAKKAERAIKSKDYAKAEEYIKQSLAKDPDYSLLYVLQGDIYYSQGMYQKAIDTYTKALEKNPADYQAYGRRGSAHTKKENWDSAKTDLINAIINARNDKSAWDALKTLGRRIGFKVMDEPFVPLYRIEKMDSGLFRIYVDDTYTYRWSAYSLNKAVWRYSPNFFTQRTGEKEYRPTLKEENECIRNMLWFYNASRMQKGIDKDPFVERILKIDDRFFLREFILWNVLSPDNPEILLTLDKSHRMDLIDYINEFILIETP